MRDQVLDTERENARMGSEQHANAAAYQREIWFRSSQRVAGACVFFPAG